MNTDAPLHDGPLAGLKVLELGQLIAGPFAGKTLADFGATVIKVEPPGSGDPLRQWRMLHEGESVWWQVQSRNKQSITLDLREPADRALARRLAAESDVLIENFRPGLMEEWGLGYDTLAADNPGLIMLRISGYGQVVDVALYESVFNCMESLLPEYSAFGAVREPAGSALPGIAPSNAYRCADGQVVIGGNGDSIFKRLMSAIGREDLGQDPGLAGNAGRAARADELAAAITAWTVQRPVDEVLRLLQAVRVPVGRIYTARDIAEDPHYRARGMIESITTARGLALEVPGVVPKLSDTPGRLRSLAPALGEHNAAVLDALNRPPAEPGKT